jgi:hypothetical protein
VTTSDTLLKTQPAAFLDPKQMADETGLHYRTILNAIARGDILAGDASGVGRGPYRIPTTELVEWPRRMAAKAAARSARAAHTSGLKTAIAPVDAPDMRTFATKRRTSNRVAIFPA